MGLSFTELENPLQVRCHRGESTMQKIKPARMRQAKDLASTKNAEDLQQEKASQMPTGRMLRFGLFMRCT